LCEDYFAAKLGQGGPNRKCVKLVTDFGLHPEGLTDIRALDESDESFSNTQFCKAAR